MHNETEKHNKIIQAAATLFAKNGYKKTTIDEIVAKAGISKGLFYHYFADKKELYLYLYNTYVDILSDNIPQKIDLSEQDFFLRIKQIAYIRVEFCIKYPDFWDFLYSAYSEKHSDIEPLIKEKNNELLENSYSGSAFNINWSKLKDGLSPNKAIEIVTWITEGFMHKLKENNKTITIECVNQFDEYMECLKTGFYKEGE